MGAYRELVELNIVLDNLLVVLHLQVIDRVFGIGGRVYGAKLGSEGADEGGPVVHPYRIFIVVQEGGFKEFQGGASEIQECECYFVGVILISGVVMKIKVAKQNEKKKC